MRRDHGGHIDYRSDVGNYSWVALYGIHDSDNHLDPDPQLEITGTYALCHAPYVPGDYSDCLTWTPHPDNYTFHSNVQIHIRHKPPSAPLIPHPHNPTEVDSSHQ